MIAPEMRRSKIVLLTIILTCLVLLSGTAQARHKKKPTPTPVPTATPTPTPSPTPTPTPTPQPTPVGKARLETYPDLINKAHNLTMQRDRLQASQVLVRGLARESKGSVAYREISRALNELSRVFYTEKAQSLFALGESLAEVKPKDAIDRWSEALRLEDGNVTVLQALARTELRTGECAAAEPNIKQALLIDPVAADLKLLQVQLLNCQKHFDELTEALAQKPSDLGDDERAWAGLVIEDLTRHEQLKKAKTTAAALEQSAPDYPQSLYWRWKLSNTPPNDHAAGQRYVMLCQALTLRKKKMYVNDLALCTEREQVEGVLKDESNDEK